MGERQVIIPTADGQMPTFVATPDAPARGVVVVLMDGRSIREPMRDHARRLAANGYYALLPNLFYRHAGQGPIENVEDMAWMNTLNTAITPARAAADVQACLDFAAQDPAAPKAARAGLLGFCMGGRLSVTAAQQLGERISAVVSLHPGYMATRAETSPHRALDRIRARIYFGIAEQDPHLSPGAVGRLREALDANHVDYELEVLPGTGHGYSTPGNETYDRDAAEHAWQKALDLFEGAK